MNILKRSLIGVGALGAVLSAQAQWNVGVWYQGGPENHWYSVQLISGTTTGWLIARAQAQALGSGTDLASITSAAENAFIFAGIDTPTYWTIDTAGNNEGPNIGGYQTDQLLEPNGHWAWVSGEAWAFTAWASGEPNNFGGAEDYATYFTQGSGRAAFWNDISSNTGTVGQPGHISYYVAESAVPEPMSMVVLGGGLLALLRRRKK